MNNRAERLICGIKEDEAFLITSSENIFYLSGFTGEGMLLIDRCRRIIITDFRYIEAAEANKFGFESVNITFGIENIIGKNIKTLIIEEDNVSVSKYKAYQNKMPNIKFIDASAQINELRLIKDACELENIKIAAQIATHAFEKVISQMGVGVSERELALMFEGLVKKEGASALSFDTIVASGENSSMPHAGVTQRKLQRGDFVTLDFGCVYNGYCSDMTRTVAIGKVNSEQKSIYELVLKAQTAALKSAISGCVCRDVDGVARSIITAAGYGDNFGHALGHGVGIFVHEQPRLSSKSEQILKNGMVVTIEPGIYLKSKFGVRIEDLIIINDETPINLSHFPKELLII